MKSVQDIQDAINNIQLELMTTPMTTFLQKVATISTDIAEVRADISHAARMDAGATELTAMLLKQSRQLDQISNASSQMYQLTVSISSLQQ